MVGWFRKVGRPEPAQLGIESVRSIIVIEDSAVGALAKAILVPAALCRGRSALSGAGAAPPVEGRAHEPRRSGTTRLVAGRPGRSPNATSVVCCRNPAAIVPSLLFPFLFIVALTGAYSGVAETPGFPVDKLVTWMLPFTVVQSSVIGGMTTGLGVIGSLETKAYDRLLMAPAPRSALIGGLYLAAMMRTLHSAILVSVLGFAQGAALPGGVLGCSCSFRGRRGRLLARRGLGHRYGVTREDVQGGADPVHGRVSWPRSWPRFRFR